MDGHWLRAFASDEPYEPRLRVLPIANPAVGADLTYTVPGESVFALVALTALLTPDSNATARGVVVQITDGTNTICAVPAGATIAASTATTVSYIADGTTTLTTAIGATLTVNLPKLILPGGHVIKTATTAIHSGDQWSAAVLTVVELFRGETARERAIVDRIYERIEAIAEYVLPGG